MIFDTETTTDPSQRLRFGAYQVRDHGQLIERGLFSAEDIPAEDPVVLRAAFAALEQTDDGEEFQLLTRAEFVEQILFGWGLETGGLIVGFNLPFDLSRLAIRHTWGKGAFKGGFSFTLAEGRPNVRIKHLSQRASFIDFAGKDGDDKSPDRGFFVDVKTLTPSDTAALALTTAGLDGARKPELPMDLIAMAENAVREKSKTTRARVDVKASRHLRTSRSSRISLSGEGRRTKAPSAK